MKKHFFACLLMIFGHFAKAQLADGSIAPDFTATDLNGKAWQLYDVLNQGKTVILDISATWCAPCWNYHQSGTLESLYEKYGPSGTDELMVFFIEGDPSTSIADLYDMGTNSQGDWVAGTPYPIIDAAAIADNYNNAYFPTIYSICPNRIITQIGQASEGAIYDFSKSCAKTSGQNNAAALKYIGPSGDFCEFPKFSPAFYLQNMGLAPLTSAKLELLLDGQIAQTINWSGNLAGYETQIINFSEITIDKNAELKIQVSEPNGLADAEPANNQLVENFTVSPAVETAVLDLEIQFDAFPISNYWELADANGQILYFGGNPRAKSANQPIVKEYNTANALVHHTLGLPANGCYQFSFYDIIGDGICCGSGQRYYRLKDFSGTILVEGSDFGSIKSDPFGIKNSPGTKNNASLISMEPLDDDFCGQYSVNPTVAVQNLGGNAISKIGFKISGNSGLYKDANWTGTISSGEVKTISLGTVTVAETDDLKVEIVSINDEPDTFLFKNTVSQKLIRRTTPKTSWIIDIITDFYGYQTYWQLTDDQANILESGGNTLVGLNGGGLQIAQQSDPGAYQAFQHIIKTVNLPANGCYHFTVVDDWGNGMTANAFGQPTAFARIRNPQVGIIAGTDGDFDGKFSTNIELSAPVSVEATDDSKIEVFPNPAFSEINVRFSEKTPASVALFNSLGQLVFEKKSTTNECTIPVNGLSDGLYFLEIRSDTQAFTRKILVQK